MGSGKKQPRKKTTSGVLASMTGFGRGVARSAGASFESEIRSVNNRHLDIILRLPPGMSEFESEIRELVQKRVTRGRIELSVTRAQNGSTTQEVRFDKDLFRSLLSVYRDAMRVGSVRSDSGTGAMMVCELLNRREVLSIDTVRTAAPIEKKVVLQAVEEACEALRSMRLREGSRLAVDLGLLLDSLRATLKAIVRRAPESNRAAEDRLRTRLKRFTPELVPHESRVAQEIALILERLDVSEEITRIESHLVEFTEALTVSGQGRRLDFVVQELTREFNTIASKAQDAVVQSAVVDAKSLLEKIREQVQNIE
jgi:uncharacterized protein (TIGR00255 family)